MLVRNESGRRAAFSKHTERSDWVKTSRPTLMIVTYRFELDELSLFYIHLCIENRR